MKSYYLSCIRERALRDGESEYFKIGHSNDLDLQIISMRTANSRAFQTVFVLGPFLDRDEAELVESQAHSLLAEYRVRGEWFDVNPLEIAEFWEWVDAQILPIRVHEERALPQLPSGRNWMFDRPMLSAERRTGVERRAPKSVGAWPG